MADRVRVRVEFADRHILAKPQRVEGLKRCWLRLTPAIATISDLAAHIVSTFSLRESCPHGLLLSMDDFVLPPFESSCILKDKETIRVERKGAATMDVIEICDDLHQIQDSEIGEKQHLLSSNKLLAIREFQENSDDHNNKDEEDVDIRKEDAISTGSPSGEKTKLKRKRKHSDKLQSLKGKKLKLSSPEKPVSSAEGGNIHIEQKLSCSKTKDRSKTKDHSKKRLKLIDTPSNRDCRTETPSTCQFDDKAVKMTSSVQSEERNCQVQENSHKETCDPDANGHAEKRPSRAARRKKIKRKWLQELRKMEKQMQENGTHKTLSEQQNIDDDTEREEEVVPIVVRPGHIRFEPLDADRSTWQTEAPMETLQWNGTTSKKKGQKWGREKAIIKRNDANACNEESQRKSVAGKGKAVNGHVDFQSLFPLTRIPKKGDVLVYRLVELSNSLCPEVSPFRVGEVSSYDPVSFNIVIVPVSEYPVFSNVEEEREDSMLVLGDSPYKEDGSLEIDYPSLVDVRLFKDSEPQATSADTIGRETTGDVTTPVNNWELALGDKNLKVANVPSTGNGESIAWGEIKQALNEKKAELAERNSGWGSWTANRSTASTSWSYRALRSSALGPTVAFLRGKGSKNGFSK